MLKGSRSTTIPNDMYVGVYKVRDIEYLSVVIFYYQFDKRDLDM